MGFGPPQVTAARSRVAVGDAWVELSWAAVTHEGTIRPTNQDAYRVHEGAFVVCDGMGGHLGGERASTVAADVVAEVWSEGRCPTVADIHRAIAAANDLVVSESLSDESVAGMGTTVVALVVADNGGTPVLVGLNLGDSRLYRRDGALVEQISHDHSVVQELMDAGRITSEQSRTHVERHVVTKVVGSEPLPDPDMWLLDVVPGARYLLTTDGIHGDLDDDTVAAEMERTAPSEVVDGLARGALLAGGRDNLTALVVDVVDLSLPVRWGDDTLPRSALPRRAPEDRPEGSVDE